jgi:type IV pilus biogenesis protein CpaD/CtpE
MSTHGKHLLSRGALALVIALGLAGCAAAPSSDTESAPAAAEADAPAMEMGPKALTIAREIEANPDQGEQILESHGMTAESFQALMVEIAEDPAMAEAYAAARAGGS